jgi:hypothetical protein
LHTLSRYGGYPLAWPMISTTASYSPLRSINEILLICS